MCNVEAIDLIWMCNIYKRTGSLAVTSDNLKAIVHREKHIKLFEVYKVFIQSKEWRSWKLFINYTVKARKSRNSCEVHKLRKSCPTLPTYITLEELYKPSTKNFRNALHTAKKSKSRNFLCFCWWSGVRSRSRGLETSIVIIRLTITADRSTYPSQCKSHSHESKKKIILSIYPMDVVRDVSRAGNHGWTDGSHLNKLASNSSISSNVAGIPSRLSQATIMFCSSFW